MPAYSEVLRDTSRIVRYTLGHEDDFIAHDAACAAILNLAKFDPQRASFRTWLWRITRNLCFMSLRRSPVKLPPQATSYADLELRLSLEEALLHLPAEDVALFYLHLIGESDREISERTQLSVGAIRMRRHELRAKLKEG